ncbi:hypothetical protein [Pectinatus cerevisiiphilus]|uniref:Uncharacterized protein n=1 Tax=Pectinatus cerevisiiphilus TaxID=86956 RepID=A0A4R3K5W9_9FIRM|nr:hypothetical protein [Pectinatus cerevisiiphilus]TCS78165.1 hypothetical protein EDC37_11122 [Pectinatus cerevisiiphilus]
MEMIGNNFRVAVSYSTFIEYSDVGYVEYNIEDKRADVFLKSERAVAAAKEFFAKKLTLQVPHKTMQDFTQITIKPLESLESFKLALTRLWENTHVYVDWSRPVEYAINTLRQNK